MKFDAKEINAFNEIGRDTFAAELTMRIASEYCANSLNEILKRERELWESLARCYDLDLVNCNYSMHLTDGSIVETRGDPK